MRKFSFLVICAVMALFTFSVKAGNSWNMELQPLTPESFYLIDEPGLLTLVVTEAGLRPVTASFGIASRRHGMEAESELLFAADQALYQAKHNGRNQIVMAANS